VTQRRQRFSVTQKEGLLTNAQPGREGAACQTPACPESRGMSTFHRSQLELDRAVAPSAGVGCRYDENVTLSSSHSRPLHRLPQNLHLLSFAVRTTAQKSGQRTKRFAFSELFRNCIRELALCTFHEGKTPKQKTSTVSLLPCPGMASKLRVNVFANDPGLRSTGGKCLIVPVRFCPPPGLFLAGPEAAGDDRAEGGSHVGGDSVGRCFGVGRSQAGLRRRCRQATLHRQRRGGTSATLFGAQVVECLGELTWLAIYRWRTWTRSCPTTCSTSPTAKTSASPEARRPPRHPPRSSRACVPLARHMSTAV
jgi:hypothetical protein